MATPQTTFNQQWGGVSASPLDLTLIMRSLIYWITLTCLFVVSTAAQDTTTINTDNASELQLIQTLAGHTAAVNDLVFTPDGTQLLSASSDITLKVWDVATAETIATLDGQLTEVRSVDIAPDGKTALTTGFQGAAFLWDLPTETRGGSFTWQAAFTDGIFSPDAQSAAFAIGDGAVRIFDTETHELTQTLIPPDDTLLIERIAYHPDGTRLAAGLGFPSDRVIVWDIDSGDILYTVDELSGTVYGIDFNSDGSLLVTSSGDGSINLWNPDTGEALMSLNGHDGEVYTVIFSPDDALIASAGFDGTVRLWDTESGEQLAEYQPETPARSLTTLAFSADGSQLAAAGELGIIYIWGISP